VSDERCPRCGAERHTADHIPNNLREYLCGSGIDLHGFYESKECKLRQLDTLRADNARLRGELGEHTEAGCTCLKCRCRRAEIEAKDCAKLLGETADQLQRYEVVVEAARHIVIAWGVTHWVEPEVKAIEQALADLEVSHD
jgi:hypothetical protein